MTAFRNRVTELLALVGLSLGLLGAVMATGYLSTIFYGIDPVEPLVYGGAAAVLGLVALSACAIPARRILRLDPTAALRAE